MESFNVFQLFFNTLSLEMSVAAIIINGITVYKSFKTRRVIKEWIQENEK